jgi:uncharacterized protein
MTAEEIIKNLGLTKHIEGGFYKETYRAKTIIEQENGKVRNTGTAIYYLLREQDKSHFHKVGSDEIWLFHQGEPIEMYIITEDGNLQTKVLGNAFDKGEEPQITILANTWFAAKIKSGTAFAFVSCVVAPGFDFEDYHIGHKHELAKLFPKIEKDIEAMCLS